MSEREGWEYAAQEGRLGELVDTTVRIVNWNLWWRFGPWRERQPAIHATLQALDADILTFQEAWTDPEREQAAEIAATLGFEHHVFAEGFDHEGVGFGNALVSRWPIVATEARPLPDPSAEGELRNVLRAEIDGPRGRLVVLTTHLNYRLDHSAIRQEQVSLVARLARDEAVADYPTIITGDFNAVPDSEEIRMMRGRTTVPAPPAVFIDAWDFADPAEDPNTWSNDNDFVAMVLEPDARIDYIFVGYPKAGGRGHPTAVTRVGTEPVDGMWPSDHFGLVADLRY